MQRQAARRRKCATALTRMLICMRRVIIAVISRRFIRDERLPRRGKPRKFKVTVGEWASGRAGERARGRGGGGARGRGGEWEGGRGGEWENGRRGDRSVRPLSHSPTLPLAR